MMEYPNEAYESKEDEILALIEMYGMVDGSHHKQWVLTEIVRIIKEDEDSFQVWKEAYCMGEDGPDTYSWDEGIAP